MSKMSLPACGQSLTRLPLLTSTPPTIDALRRRPLQSLDFEGIYLLPSPQRLETPDGAVQAHQVFLAQRLAAVQDLTRPRVGGPRLLLLLVREAEDAQREQLVYLPPVEEVAGALRRYPADSRTG